MTIIKIIGLVNGQPTPHDGLYVEAYDPSYSPDGDRMTCYLRCVADPNAARKFKDAAEAMEFCLRVNERDPVMNGIPNRPLRAFTVELTTPEMEVNKP